MRIEHILSKQYSIIASRTGVIFAKAQVKNSAYHSKLEEYSQASKTLRKTPNAQKNLYKKLVAECPELKILKQDRERLKELNRKYGLIVAALIKRAWMHFEGQRGMPHGEAVPTKLLAEYHDQVKSVMSNYTEKLIKDGSIFNPTAWV